MEYDAEERPSADETRAWLEVGCCDKGGDQKAACAQRHIRGAMQKRAGSPPDSHRTVVVYTCSWIVPPVQAIQYLNVLPTNLAQLSIGIYTKLPVGPLPRFCQKALSASRHTHLFTNHRPTISTSCACADFVTLRR